MGDSGIKAGTAALAALLVAFGGLCASTAHAWTHPLHRSLASLTLAGAAGKSPYLLEQSLMTGSTESDHGRDHRPGINTSHKTDSWRIQATFDAAVKVFYVQCEPYAEASRRIGRAFHYLQDQTELPDSLRRRFFDDRREGSREFGERVLGDLDTPDPRGRNAYRDGLADRTRQYGSFGWDRINGTVDAVAREFASGVSNALEEIGRKQVSPEGAELILTTVFRTYFASMVALQNRIVRLYEERAGEFDVAMGQGTWEGTWQVTSDWKSHPDIKPVTWRFSVVGSGDGWRVRNEFGNEFPATLTEKRLKFTDQTGRVHRVVEYQFDRKPECLILGGNFTGFNKRGDHIKGDYVGRKLRGP